jgi:hypothetical protein
MMQIEKNAALGPLDLWQSVTDQSIECSGRTRVKRESDHQAAHPEPPRPVGKLSPTSRSKAAAAHDEA